MYEPPELDDIMEDLRSSVKASVAGTDPWIWPNNLVPVLKAVAQGLRAASLRLEYVHEQAFVQTAVADYLDWHGIQSGGLSRNPAAYASGTLNVPAVLGTTVNDGTRLANAASEEYVTIGTTTATVTPVPVMARAVNPGELGNLDAGAVLTPLAPIPGVTGNITVATGGLIGGAEEESDDSFRQRILFMKQNPPRGGAPSEYYDWAQTKAGVTRVFVQRATHPTLGPTPGAVTIYFMMDGIGDGVPTTNDVAELQGILDTLGPADANIVVAKPTRYDVNVTVSNLSPNTTAVQNAVIDELKAMFLRMAEPAAAGAPFTFSRAWLTEATSMAPGWRSSKITVPTPGTDVVVSTAGQLPVLGVVSFNTV